MANSDITTAVISAIFSSSIIGGVITYVLNKRIEKYKKMGEIELKHLEDDLANKTAERDARRDYEYEAKKRLYHEIEPYLFLFLELSGSALSRIYRLASVAKEGKLYPNTGWLSGPGYFINSTIYRLIAPLAAFKLIQRRLTIVDLELEPRINIQYSLGKCLYSTISDDFDLAQSQPIIVGYKPYENYIGTQEEIHFHQGIYTGLIDSITELLTVDEPKGGLRVLTFGEFESKYMKAKVPESLQKFYTLFLNFHPKTRPVLWRILVAQAHIYMALKEIQQMKFNDFGSNLRPLKVLYETKSPEFDWHKHKEETSIDSNPLEGVENYFRQHWSNLIDIQGKSSQT